MKTRHVLLTAIIASFFFFTGCSDDDDDIQEAGAASQGTLVTKSASSQKSAAISNEYPQAQQEVIETFNELGAIIAEGAGSGYHSELMDEFIAYHAYGSKFTEFNGGLSFDSEENEHNERQLFGEGIAEDGVLQFAAKEGSLKVAVYYGNVANMTFISDFILKLQDGSIITVQNQITLLWVKIKGKWKIVHEHHSPSNE